MKIGQKVYLKCRAHGSGLILKFPMTVKATRPKSGDVYVVDNFGAHWVNTRNTYKDALWITTK